MTAPGFKGAAVIDFAADYFARIDFRPLPADNFDLSSASEALLRHHGFPSPAQAVGTPEIAAFYRRFLQPRADGTPLRFVSAATIPTTGTVVRVAPLSAPAPWPAQKSVNWSGGYVTPREGRSLTGVMGTWTVPQVSEPPGAAEPRYHSSTWIGLDGQRLYNDSSLPQIGTRQRWVRAATPKQDLYDAWFQWWARGEQNPPIPLPSFDVKPGDTISAILTVLNPTTVRFNLKNVTQGMMLQPFDVPAPGSRIVSGATAEWIMERPSPMGADGWGAYRLPAYTSFRFTGCLAQARAPGETTAAEVDLGTVRLIRMYELSANPPSLRTVSVASRILGADQKLELSHVRA
jgi:hypothetical protein